ncbi:MAG TPA: hypothetical protein VHS28_00810 [Chloroflexota bacterium]|nr:hypothetical protein [Chloroflexota bacterium]
MTTEESSAINTLRRKRRRHPSLIQTANGIEEIVPGLSSWTAEDLLEAGAWDDELAGFGGAAQDEESADYDRDLDE